MKTQQCTIITVSSVCNEINLARTLDIVPIKESWVCPYSEFYRPTADALVAAGRNDLRSDFFYNNTTKLVSSLAPLLALQWRIFGKLSHQTA
jgi:hypothetical protein